MLIVCKKFRSRTLGYCIRSCHIITCNMREMWGLFYSHAMRTLPTSCHVSQHMQLRHAHIVRHMHTGKPTALIIHGVPGNTYGRAFAQAELYLSKITASHFNTLNMKIANQNVLERILIAMLNENTAVSNENFRI